MKFLIDKLHLKCINVKKVLKTPSIHINKKYLHVHPNSNLYAVLTIVSKEYTIFYWIIIEIYNHVCICINLISNGSKILTGLLTKIIQLHMRCLVLNWSHFI